MANGERNPGATVALVLGLFGSLAVIYFMTDQRVRATETLMGERIQGLEEQLGVRIATAGQLTSDLASDINRRIDTLTEKQGDHIGNSGHPHSTVLMLQEIANRFDRHETRPFHASAPHLLSDIAAHEERIRGLERAVFGAKDGT